MWQEGNTVYAKLFQLNRENNSTVDNFFIQCEVQFLSVWDGERVKAKGATEMAFNAASQQLNAFVENDSPNLRLFFRKICIGRALRDSIFSGFSNLNSCRVSLGPYNIFCDGLILGFGTGPSRKFSLLEDEDFFFRWPYGWEMGCQARKGFRKFF